MKEIKLTKGKVALVDDSDYDWLNQWKWYAIKGEQTYYAGRGMMEGDKIIRILMHRFILGITDPIIFGDHEDHNGLNNQRYNIRIATPRQNSCNKTSNRDSTSKYLGVHWKKQFKKWEAFICKNGKNKFIGRFDNESDAALAYNKKAIELHGEFANLNILSENQQTLQTA